MYFYTVLKCIITLFYLLSKKKEAFEIIYLSGNHLRHVTTASAGISEVARETDRLHYIKRVLFFKVGIFMIHCYVKYMSNSVFLKRYDGKRIVVCT